MLIPNLDFGGAQRSFCNLANALSEDHAVTIAVFNTIEGVSFEYNCKIIDLDIPGGSFFFSKAYYFLKRWHAVRNIKNKLGIDTTISYLEGANYINALTGTDRKVLSVRGSKSYDENIRGPLGWIRKNLLIPFVYKRSSHIVALNNGIKRELELEYGIAPKKVMVIRNFYDTSKIRELAQMPFCEELRFLKGASYLIYAGRLASGKGLKSILEVFAMLKQKHHGLKLVLVGDGPMKPELVRFAQHYGFTVFVQEVSDNSRIARSDVLFLGYRDNPYQLIRRAEMLIIASTSEGGPNILMEALICGTLVVSTDCPYGPGEQLAPELNGKQVATAQEVNHGILLPLLDKTNPDPQLHQWSDIISAYLTKKNKRDKVIERALEWTQIQSPENVLNKWRKVI
jgi:glycosyltransferase involved in cell wall biosynthesis